VARRRSAPKSSASQPGFQYLSGYVEFWLRFTGVREVVTLTLEHTSFDPAIRQTRMGWLGAWSDSPGAANLNGLLDRLDFLCGLAIDPTCRTAVHPERWKQIVREGNAAPACGAMSQCGNIACFV
jgi:hypothetical protein